MTSGDDFVVCHELDEHRLAQLTALFAEAWWASERTEAEIAALVRGSDLVVGLVRRSDDRLVGFCRVLTDWAYVALIFDVVVAGDVRGRGLGDRLMADIVARPELSAVRSLELVCQPDLVGFYERWGFTDQVGGSQLMRRTTDPRLRRG
ncbi:MAG: GNAT family N-acetyltransferase [Hamadaea sp.]|uniref:GNAT family N-acetyltransferase n=1 Tax=Hamadaea sp. TaxID=2024425 RepID=UPI0017F10FF0|nr:GNAT family N-acetyltransferase [Hamadaea sp.]NUT17864.1 GNAT family N-acetyltransferase [Hamadaea sp.]